MAIIMCVKVPPGAMAPFALTFYYVPGYAVV